MVIKRMVMTWIFVIFRGISTSALENLQDTKSDGHHHTETQCQRQCLSCQSSRQIGFGKSSDMMNPYGFGMGFCVTLVNAIVTQPLCISKTIKSYRHRHVLSHWPTETSHNCFKTFNSTFDSFSQPGSKYLTVAAR
jgi:hypothetical protein